MIVNKIIVIESGIVVFVNFVFHGAYGEVFYSEIYNTSSNDPASITTLWRNISLNWHFVERATVFWQIDSKVSIVNVKNT